MKTWWILGKEYSAADDMLISSLGTLPKLQHTMTNHVMKNGDNGGYMPSVNA